MLVVDNNVCFIQYDERRDRYPQHLQSLRQWWDYTCILGLEWDDRDFLILSLRCDIDARPSETDMNRVSFSCGTDSELRGSRRFGERGGDYMDHKIPELPSRGCLTWLTSLFRYVKMRDLISLFFSAAVVTVSFRIHSQTDRSYHSTVIGTVFITTHIDTLLQIWLLTSSRPDRSSVVLDVILQCSVHMFLLKSSRS